MQHFFNSVRSEVDVNAILQLLCVHTTHLFCTRMCTLWGKGYVQV